MRATAKGIDCLREYSTEWDEKAHAFKLTRSTTGHRTARTLALPFARLESPMRPPEPLPPPIMAPLGQITMQQFMDLEDAHAPTGAGRL